jgi:hypothetical protein
MSVLLLCRRSVRSSDDIRAIGGHGFDATCSQVGLEARATLRIAAEFLRVLTERLNASPGVLSAVFQILPLTLSNKAMPFLLEGEARSRAGEPPPRPFVYMNGVGPGHFKTVRIVMTAGRNYRPRPSRRRSSAS